MDGEGLSVFNGHPFKAVRRVNMCLCVCEEEWVGFRPDQLVFMRFDQ